MTNKEIEERLFAIRDEQYGSFQSKLIPSVDKSAVIGVRTPALRKFAKELFADGAEEFLEALPHSYFDENQLHAFVISLIKDFDSCLAEVERFLPYVDNWATCDQMSPKVFKKHRQKLIVPIDRWLKSGRTYTVRFGVKQLMDHFLDDGFKPEFAETVANIKSGEYYVNMMRAWYFATALAKQYESVLPYFTGDRLDRPTRGKAIQKAIESYRITPEQKELLRALRTKL